MSTLLYGINATGVPGDEATVRSTVTVVADDTAAVQPDAPDWNETRTDPVTEGGLTPHDLASHVVPSVRYVPDMGDSNAEHNEIVNRQVSSSGTAAAREASGVQGHGTLMVTQGIEPTIVDGHEFREDYFAAHDRIAQQDVTPYMTPGRTADSATSAAAQAAGEAASRAAAQASQYAAFHRATTGL